MKHYIRLTCFRHVASELGYNEDVVCMPMVLIFDFVPTLVNSLTGLRVGGNSNYAHDVITFDNVM